MLRTQGSYETGTQVARLVREAKAAGTAPRYRDSVETLVRNLIQKQKIDMANEVGGGGGVVWCARVCIMRVHVCCSG